MQINLSHWEMFQKNLWRRATREDLSYWSPDDFSIIVIIVGKKWKKQTFRKKTHPDAPFAPPKKTHPDAPFAPPKIFLKEVRMKKKQIKKTSKRPRLVEVIHFA